MQGHRYRFHAESACAGGFVSLGLGTRLTTSPLLATALGEECGPQLRSLWLREAAIAQCGREMLKDDGELFIFDAALLEEEFKIAPDTVARTSADAAKCLSMVRLNDSVSRSFRRPIRLSLATRSAKAPATAAMAGIPPSRLYKASERISLDAHPANKTAPIAHQNEVMGAL